MPHELRLTTADFGWPGDEASFKAATDAIAARVAPMLAGEHPALIGYVLARMTGQFVGSILPVELQAEVLRMHVETAKAHAALQSDESLAVMARLTGALQ